MNSALRILLLYIVVVFISLLGCTQAPAVDVKRSNTAGYWDSKLCKNCHERAYEEHFKSRHSQSYSNEVFQAQYFKEIVPLALKDPNLMGEARKCMACHNPVVHMTLDKPILKKEEGQMYADNVTCDFCHTVSAIDGDLPGDANYISTPGENKYGPHNVTTDWHHVYNPLYVKSELCGTCHNAHNYRGQEIKSTFSEWAQSVYARRDIQCQDCHMNVMGYLSGDTPIFDAGQAAKMQMKIVKPPHRKQLHTHRFPGSYSTNQVSGAIKVDLKLDRRRVSTGEKVRAVVSVDNRRAGHKMPTGSTELRVMWLDVRVHYDGHEEAVRAQPYNGSKVASYEIAGMGAADDILLNGKIPEGSRVYRQVFLDESGKQTIRSYDIVSSAFDNRLGAAEVREEEFEFRAPKKKGGIQISATLYYVAYPDVMARELGIESAKLIQVSKDMAELLVQ